MKPPNSSTEWVWLQFGAEQVADSGVLHLEMTQLEREPKEQSLNIWAVNLKLQKKVAKSWVKQQIWLNDSFHIQMTLCCKTLVTATLTPH